MGSSTSKQKAAKVYPLPTPTYPAAYLPQQPPVWPPQYGAAMTGTSSKATHRTSRRHKRQESAPAAYPQSYQTSSYTPQPQPQPQPQAQYMPQYAPQQPYPPYQQPQAQPPDVVLPPGFQPTPRGTTPSMNVYAMPAAMPTAVPYPTTAPTQPTFVPGGVPPPGMFTGDPGPSTARRSNTPHPRASSAQRARERAEEEAEQRELEAEAAAARAQDERAQQRVPSRTASRAHAHAHARTPSLAERLRAPTPAAPAVFGPAQAAPQPPHNPLPPPPRDLYELTPYKQLLDLPHTGALLTAAYVPPPARRKTGLFGSRGRKGLFRSLSARGTEDPEFRPVFRTQQVPPPGDLAMPPPPAPAPPSPATGVDHARAPIRFTYQTPYWGFLNHASYRVLYNNSTYKTATNLHEALKFLPHRPDIAERLRECPIEDVYPLSAQYSEHTRTDWGSIFMGMMEEVVYLKFRQHPEIRAVLMGTGDADLIYADPQDTFWGEGAVGNGANELGKILVRVRARLREEGSGR